MKTLRTLLPMVTVWLMQAQIAHASLGDELDRLMDGVMRISVPLAIIMLIIAGWQKMLGNDQLFRSALIGAVIIFASPLIVEFIRNAFGVN